MARESRVVAEGVPHHLTQRGNIRQDVFLQDADRRLYLETLRAKARDHDLTVLGYCLMTNHVHLVVVPRRSTSLARAVGQAHRRYTSAFNRKYGRSGHLWQNRFYSCPLGPERLVAALAYVDLNPVRAGLAGAAGHYPWSSARAHAGAGAADPLLDEREWNDLGLTSDWEDRLRAEAAGGRAAEVRRATYTGLPCGGEEFVEALEKRLGRRLHPLPPGPHPRQKAGSAAAGGQVG